jgi:hypothetical protein
MLIRNGEKIKDPQLRALENEDYELLAEKALASEHGITMLARHGEELENYYILFTDVNTVQFFIMKSCQSNFGWHVLEVFNDYKKAAKRFQWLKENDIENKFVKEMNKKKTSKIPFVIKMTNENKTDNKNKDGIFLFTQDGCPFCGEEKNRLTKGPLRDQVKILDLSNDVVMDNPVVQNLIEKLDISGVPQVISVTGNKACIMERDDTGVLRRGKCATVAGKL